MDLRTDRIIVEGKPTGPQSVTLTAQSPADALLRTGAGFAVRLTTLIDCYEQFAVPGARIATDEGD